jgi:hypothetical protein
VLWRNYLFFVYDKLPIIIFGVKYLTADLIHIFFTLHHGAIFFCYGGLEFVGRLTGSNIWKLQDYYLNPAVRSF